MSPQPVFDANGAVVPLPADFPVSAEFRTFMAVRVPAVNCPHYLPVADAQAGFLTCESCSRGKVATPS